MASITKLTLNNSDNNVQYFLYTHGSVIKFGELKKYINQYGYSLIDNETAYDQAVNDVSDDITDGYVVMEGSNNNIYLQTSTTKLASRASTSELSKIDANAVSGALVVQYDQDYYQSCISYNL